MNRSKEGLQGAGEWWVLKELLPTFKEKQVLDLGCGYGWHCKYAVEQGAERVVGIDLSAKMLEVARTKNCDDKITYQQMSIEEFSFPDESFDVVVSSLAFHYVQDFKALVHKVKKVLKPEGIFIFSVEHPVFTAYGSQDWIYDEQREIAHFPVDNYYIEGKREAVFLGESVVKYHKTLTTYLNTLLVDGFKLLNVVEPAPSEEAVRTIEGMKDELRRPMMLIVKARK